MFVFLFLTVLLLVPRGCVIKKFTYQKNEGTPLELFPKHRFLTHFKHSLSFICRGCLNPVTSAVRTSVDIGASAKLELVDKFCYLGDRLSVDGDADAAVEARIRIGWNKFRQLVPLLTNKDVSLIMRGRLYSSCVQSSMLHGSETWPVRKENVVALQRAEM